MRAILLAAILAAPLAARAQVEGSTARPSVDLSAPSPAAPSPLAEPAEPPPAVKRKHGIFPLWGDKARAKGFELPEPFGFMVHYYNQKSDIEIKNLQLRFNGGEWLDASSLIQVPNARTEASALGIRPNLMLFPFLSVYAVFSAGATETNVDVAVGPPPSPLEFSTLAKSGAQVLSLGATFQMGYKGFFGVADFNGAVSDVERLSDTVGSNMLSFRLGYNFRSATRPGRGIAVWAGTAGQVLEVETEGSVRLGEVLPPPQQSTIDGVQARCDALGPLDPGDRLCDVIVQQLQDWQANGFEGTVDYRLDKKPAGVWNLILGAQYALDRSWQFRFETTFLNGRTTFLAATEYRFDVL